MPRRVDLIRTTAALMVIAPDNVLESLFKTAPDEQVTQLLDELVKLVGAVGDGDPAFRADVIAILKARKIFTVEEVVEPDPVSGLN